MKYLLLPIMLVLAGPALQSQPKPAPRTEAKPAAVQWAIEPKFRYARDFSQGMAAVQFEDKWGYINAGGAWAIAPGFYEAYPFHEGLAVFAQDSMSFGYINASGAIVIPAQFRSAARFSDGFAFVVRDDGWPCYINSFGQTVLANRNSKSETVWDYGWEFVNGIAPVSSGGSYDAALQMSGGIYFYTTKFNTYPFFSGFYDDARPFADGLAPVLKEGRWGCINAQGKTVIERTFDELHGFSGGYAVAAIRTGDLTRWRLIDTKGATMLEFPLGTEPRGEVSEGAIAARGDKGKLGIMNLSGEWIVEPVFEELSGFYSGLAAGSMDGKAYGFIRMPVKK